MEKNNTKKQANSNKSKKKIWLIGVYGCIGDRTKVVKNTKYNLKCIQHHKSAPPSGQYSANITISLKMTWQLTQQWLFSINQEGYKDQC